MYFRIGSPHQQTFTDSKQASKLVNRFNGVTNLYRSINNFFDEPCSETAIIGRIFFDFDYDPKRPYKALTDFQNLHEFLLKQDIKHITFFSGRGFHLFISVKKIRAIDLKNPNRAIRNVFYYYNTRLNLDSDPKTKDICRIARIPNTLNIRSNLYCIPIDPDFDWNIIKGLARKQHFKRYSYGTKLLNLEDYDEEMEHHISYVEKGYTTNDDKLLERLPACVTASLLRGDANLRERFHIIMAMREMSYTLEDCENTIKKYLTKVKPTGETFWEHCINTEKQVKYLYNQPHLMFSNCNTIKDEGFCVEGCRGNDIYYNPSRL